VALAGVSFSLSKENENLPALKSSVWIVPRQTIGGRSHLLSTNVGRLVQNLPVQIRHLHVVAIDDA